MLCLQTVEEKRKQVLLLCEEELAMVKREYLPDLARKYGVYQEYIKRMKVLSQSLSCNRHTVPALPPVKVLDVSA